VLTHWLTGPAGFLLPLVSGEFPFHESSGQVVRPFESVADTHPKLQPASLRLSAMISQYFIYEKSTTCFKQPWSLNETKAL
jgi:hypothetical protein